MICWLLWICLLQATYFCQELQKKGDINGFHNVLIYSVIALRLSLRSITPMISQSNGALMVHKTCNIYLCCTTSCVLDTSRGASEQQSFCLDNMQFFWHAVWALSFFPLNIMRSLCCCHFSTIDALEENDLPSWRQVYSNIFLRFLKFSHMRLSFEHDVIGRSFHSSPPLLLFLEPYFAEL